MKTRLLPICILAAATAIAHASPFATRVLSYTPGPGAPAGFTNPAAALGPPVGGSPDAPDNSKLVSLGAFGGKIVLGFDAPIDNLPPTPANPRGLDLIVFGNAFYLAGDANRRFAEAGVIEVSRDANANGLADDAWFVIPGSHLTVGGVGASNVFTLPPSVFTQSNQPIVSNPLGESATTEGVFGYADCTPTIALGDLDADGAIDAPNLDPARFFTSPDDPLAMGLTRFSGGGDAIDIAEARHPFTGEPANLASIDFVRITTGVNGGSPVLGLISTEVGAVARVIVRARADIAGPGQALGPDGERTVDDIIVFLGWFFAANTFADVAGPGQSPGADAQFTADDIIVFLGWFFGQE